MFPFGQNSSDPNSKKRGNISTTSSTAMCPSSESPRNHHIYDDHEHHGGQNDLKHKRLKSSPPATEEKPIESSVSSINKSVPAQTNDASRIIDDEDPNTILGSDRVQQQSFPPSASIYPSSLLPTAGRKQEHSNVQRQRENNDFPPRVGSCFNSNTHPNIASAKNADDEEEDSMRMISTTERTAVLPSLAFNKACSKKNRVPHQRHDIDEQSATKMISPSRAAGADRQPWMLQGGLPGTMQTNNINARREREEFNESLIKVVDEVLKIVEDDEDLLLSAGPHPSSMSMSYPKKQ